MHYHTIVFCLGSALTAWAATPSGFKPTSKVNLVVAYGGQSALNGVDLQKSLTQSEPTFGTTEPLTGKSYAIMMVDIDIPTNNPPATGTFLHWAQADLTPVAKATTVQLNDGKQTIHTLKANGGAIAPYKGPAPPAKVPLSHRYIQLLVDTSNITAAGTAALQTLSNRQGVQINDVLTKAGLANQVVAGNFFTVTNPGPAADAKKGNTTTAPTGGVTKPSSVPPSLSHGEKSTWFSPAMLLVSALGVFAGWL
ncbi:phosphatidylethanolamine-binding protein [Colletotrichum navitas]|uniref:Phosphatidylethanolamine-binding protein n=1 Tax=Colletotrichum navitas TaxID=681940 RepID=A0AAD8PJF2_9PEZI|nr:phosphatidylethanolamine-binding protein [Colletotrichum navitas]KAK1564090.1 phosphatidylethanolamine-binding protein [Colletotrichum navitas]